MEQEDHHHPKPHSLNIVIDHHEEQYRDIEETPQPQLQKNER